MSLYHVGVLFIWKHFVAFGVKRLVVLPESFQRSLFRFAFRFLAVGSQLAEVLTLWGVDGNFLNHNL